MSLSPVLPIRNDALAPRAPVHAPPTEEAIHAPSAAPSAALPSHRLGRAAVRKSSGAGGSLAYYARLLRVGCEGARPSEPAVRTGYEFQPRLPLATTKVGFEADKRRGSHTSPLAVVKDAFEGERSDGLILCLRCACD